MSDIAASEADAVGKRRSVTADLVYFIRGEATGFIKIGYSRNVKARLRTLRAGSPDKLTLIATMGGGQYVEAVLHVAFEDLRVHGEWFRPDQRLLDHIRLVGVFPPKRRWTRKSAACPFDD